MADRTEAVPACRLVAVADDYVIQRVGAERVARARPAFFYTSL